MREGNEVLALALAELTERVKESEKEVLGEVVLTQEVLRHPGADGYMRTEATGSWTACVSIRFMN